MHINYFQFIINDLLFRMISKKILNHADYVLMAKFLIYDN